MIYGDTVNQTDSLGLTNYAYRPNISAVMQSGNLYVYGINNPLTFTDYSGRAITLAVFATRFLIGVATQAATDIIKYAYSDDPNKELFSSTPMEYLWAGVSNTFSFGFGNKIVNTIAESFVSSLGQEIIAASQIESPENIDSPLDVWIDIGAGVASDLAFGLLKYDDILDEAFPITANNRNAIVSVLSPIDSVRDATNGIIEIIPKAYKNNIANSTAEIIKNQIRSCYIMEV